MAQKLGIENIEKVVRAVAAIGNSAGRTFEDGKITIGDVSELWKLSKTVQALATVNFTQLFPEGKDLDQKEFDYLCDIFVSEFNIPQNQVEQVVKVVMTKAKSLFSFVKECIDMYGQLFPKSVK